MFGQIIEIDHAAYQKKVRKLSVDSLRYTIKDCQEAIKAMPDGAKAGYYQDEVFYCCDELARRQRASLKTNRKNNREEFYNVAR